MISWVAMNRFVERKIASDAKYRKLMAGRPVLSDGERLTDEELLAKLRSFGIELDRASLGQLCEQALSAEEIAGPWLKSLTFKTRRERLEGDWIWVCLVALWRRWFPDKPSFEMLDDKIQAGYDRMAAGDPEVPGDPVAACGYWLDAWADVLRLLDKAEIRSIDELDARFQGTQSLFAWVQDLEMQLWNAGLKDRKFLTVRIGVCEESLRRFGTERDFLIENWRRALAETYFRLGETSKADTLFREWLKTDPQWGWGWIAWSDCYEFQPGRPELQDSIRAEQLLREGLSVPKVRNREHIADRLASLYEEQGRGEEAKEIRQQARKFRSAIRRMLGVRSDDSVPRQEASMRSGKEKVLPQQAAIARQKVGRNDPCPCGSGKKFKKCCGR